MKTKRKVSTSVINKNKAKKQNKKPNDTRKQSAPGYLEDNPQSKGSVKKGLK